MPCYLTGSARGDIELHYSELRREAQGLNQMLCDVCERFEQVDSLASLPLEVQEWWRHHKRVDEERKEQDKQHKERKILRLRKELHEAEAELNGP